MNQDWEHMSFREIVKKPNYIHYQEHVNLLNQQWTTDFSYGTYLDYLNGLPSNHLLYGLYHKEQMIGQVAIIIENKLIHNVNQVAHIEDLIVDQRYRRQGLGQVLLKYCLDIAQHYQCYKVILNCSPELVDFYQKTKFKSKGYQMAYYTEK